VRSVAAVLAGFITLSVALNGVQGIATAVLLRMHPDLPATTSIVNYSVASRVFWLVWETIAMTGAGYVTARVASSSHVAHATMMGLIQAVVTLWAMVSIQSQEPRWFWLTGIALMIPAAWLGGWLRVKRAASAREPSP
jgi:hypothetical protein